MCLREICDPAVSIGLMRQKQRIFSQMLVEI